MPDTESARSELTLQVRKVSGRGDFLLPDDGNSEPGKSLVFVTEIHKLRSSHKTLLELQTQGEFKGEATPNAVKLRRFFVLAFLVSCYTDATLQATTHDIAKMLLSRITRLANHLAKSSDAI